MTLGIPPTLQGKPDPTDCDDPENESGRKVVAVRENKEQKAANATEVKVLTALCCGSLV